MSKCSNAKRAATRLEARRVRCWMQKTIFQHVLSKASLLEQKNSLRSAKGESAAG